MNNWQPARPADLPAEQQTLLQEATKALGQLSHDRGGQVVLAPATDGHIRAILGPAEDGAGRHPHDLAELVAHRLAAAGLRLTADPQQLAEGYAVRVARRTGRPEVGPPVMIRFPIELLARVDAWAEKTGTSRAAAVRDLVSTGLGLIAAAAAGPVDPAPAGQ
jgi:hypothetical protein